MKKKIVFMNFSHKIVQFGGMWASINIKGLHSIDDTVSQEPKYIIDSNFHMIILWELKVK